MIIVYTISDKTEQKITIFKIALYVRNLTRNCLFYTKFGIDKYTLLSAHLG